MNARLNIRIPDAIMLAIEDLRDSRKDGADIAHVARELLVEALEARGKLSHCVASAGRHRRAGACGPR